MPLHVILGPKVKSAKKGKKPVAAAGDVFEAEANLIIEGENKGTGKVLVKDEGEGKASLIVANELATSVLMGKPVSVYGGNTIADYDGELEEGVELTFSKFSFK
jgi:hypothetical protein